MLPHRCNMTKAFIGAVRVDLGQLIMSLWRHLLNNLWLRTFFLQWNLKNLAQPCILQTPDITDLDAIVIRERP